MLNRFAKADLKKNPSSNNNNRPRGRAKKVTHTVRDTFTGRPHVARYPTRLQR